MRSCITSLCSLIALTAVGSAPIDLYCWIVADDRGSTQHSVTSVSNDVDELNKIFTQVGMSFTVLSISFTNSTHLTNIVLTNEQQIAELCSITNATGGLELYFVKTISNDANAFWVPSGIAVSSSHNRTTLAHEVGHACGLDDIYEAHKETAHRVTGAPCKAWMPRDWGWYPDRIMQTNIIQRLLMYGYDTTSKGDISRGDVYGLSYNYEWNATSNKNDKVWRLGLVPVGFKDHGIRHPVSQ